MSYKGYICFANHYLQGLILNKQWNITKIDYYPNFRFHCPKQLNFNSVPQLKLPTVPWYSETTVHYLHIPLPTPYNPIHNGTIVQNNHLSLHLLWLGKSYWMLFCLRSIHHLDNISSLLGNYLFPIACYFHEIANKGVSSDFGQRWAHDRSQVNKTVEFDSWAKWHKDRKVGLFIFMVKPWKGCSLLFEWRGLLFWTREPLIRSPEIGGQLRAQYREAVIVELGGQ